MKSANQYIFDQVCQPVYSIVNHISGRLPIVCTVEETEGSPGNAQVDARRTTSARDSTWTTTGTNVRPS